MIFDTSFIIDLIHGNPEAVRKMNDLQDSRERLFITAPTIFELWVGISQSDRPKQEKKKVTQILESQMILDFDEESAKHAGIISGTLINEGKVIDPEDCMIAGIAKHHSQKVLTRNVKHFSRIKDLKVETY